MEKNVDELKKETYDYCEFVIKGLTKIFNKYGWSGIGINDGKKYLSCLIELIDKFEELKKYKNFNKDEIDKYIKNHLCPMKNYIVSNLEIRNKKLDYVKKNIEELDKLFRNVSIRRDFVMSRSYCYNIKYINDLDYAYKKILRYQEYYQREKLILLKGGKERINSYTMDAPDYSNIRIDKIVPELQKRYDGELIYNANRKVIKLADKEQISELTESITKYEMYKKICQCINDYKLHYNEMPTPEMVNDILNTNYSTQSINEIIESLNYKNIR